MIKEPRSSRQPVPGWLRGIALLCVIGLLVYAAQQQREPPRAENPVAKERQPTAPQTRSPKAQAELPSGTPGAPHETSRGESPRKSTIPRQPDRPEFAHRDPPVSASAITTQTVIDGQTIHDQDGAIVYRGAVDVADTLNRIAVGERLRFPNDGATFQNRERRLPQQQTGYYREWVHPTPGLRGPGPQRIVTGQRGEIYYTADHYRTFRRLDGG